MNQPTTQTEPSDRATDQAELFFTLDRSRSRPYTRKEYLGRLSWHLVYTLLFRPSPNACYAWRRWLLKWFGATIGPNSRIRSSVHVMHPWLLTVGDYTTLGDRVRVYNLGPITIGDHTVVSQDVHLCAGSHDHRDPTFPLIRAEIKIGSSVWIAADAFVGPGVTVHPNAVVAARSVVVKNVGPGHLIGGNPGRSIGPARG